MAGRAARLIAGNWKMNGVGADLTELRQIAQGAETADAGAPGMLICVPATLVERASRLAASSVLSIGGQDCHTKASGAHTGDVSAAMLKDAGATHVIVGHSERRADHGESDMLVLSKARAATGEGLVAIICVGETRAEREAGQAMDVVDGQLAGSLPEDSAPESVVVAYEPVWAIGTGLTPTLHDIEAMHGHIRMRLVERFGSAGNRFTILYGGSVKPDNAADILATPDVDGALVGGASLKSADFLAICAAAPRA